MKVLFLNPPFLDGRYSRTSRSPAITKSGTLYYPFWLAYAAGVAEAGGFEVSLVDAPASGLSEEQILELCRRLAPRLIVVDTSTPSIYSDLAISSRIKESLPDSFLTLVGTHVSVLTEEALQAAPEVDAVARREYDYTIRDLARCLESGEDLSRVEGLSFRRDGEVVHNPERPLIEDIDELPFVTRVYKKHLDTRDYFFAASEYPMVMTISGRGCPFRCFFCVYPQTFHSRRYRLRSAGNVVDELEFVAREMPEVKEIGFEDDTFTAKLERTREICELILKKRLKVKWYCNTRVHLDLETMRLMRRAGCQLLIAGFESGDQAVLDGMRKKITVDQIVQFARNARRAGLMVHGCFMAGNPGETPATLEKTLGLAKRLNTDTMQFFPLMVYPGTEAFDWVKDNGYLRATNYREWLTPEGLHECVVDGPQLTSKQLVEFCDRARREYYFRPRYLLKKSWQMVRDPAQLYRTARATRSIWSYLREGSYGLRVGKTAAGVETNVKRGNSSSDFA